MTTNSIMNRRRQSDYVRAIVAYATRAAVAGLLMMWGTMNLVHNVVDCSRGPEGRNWWIAALLVLVTALVPLVIGFRMSLKLFRDSNRSK